MNRSPSCTEECETFLMSFTNKGEFVMKRVLVAVLAFTFVAGGVSQLWGAPQTVEGVVSDSMCGSKHMLPGKTDAECIKECLGGKTTYALVVGGKVYTLAGPVAEFAKYAGQKVRVTGDVGKDAIVVTTIGAASR